MSRKIATVTIGQSPRTNVVPELVPFLGEEVEVLEAGALDGLDDLAIANLAPNCGDFVLVSRLRDGREVKLRRDDLYVRMQSTLDRVAPCSEAVLVLCTGTFPRLTCVRPVLYPEHLLFHVTRAVAGEGPLVHVGVLTPGPEQVSEQQERWEHALGTGAKVTVLTVSPYQNAESADDEIRRAGAQFQEAGAQIVVMDCLGYTRAMKRVMRSKFRGPVLLARTVLARIAGELLQDD